MKPTSNTGIKATNEFLEFRDNVRVRYFPNATGNELAAHFKDICTYFKALQEITPKLDELNLFYDVEMGDATYNFISMTTYQKGGTFRINLNSPKSKQIEYDLLGFTEYTEIENIHFAANQFLRNFE